MGFNLMSTATVITVFVAAVILIGVWVFFKLLPLILIGAAIFFIVRWYKRRKNRPIDAGCSVFDRNGKRVI